MKARLRKWLKRVLYLVGGLVVVVVLAVASAIAYLGSDSGREMVRTRAETELGKLFVGGASIGRIEGSIVSGFVLRDLTINDASGAPAITLSRARIEYTLLPLLGKRLVVDTVELEGLRVFVRQNAAGELNMATLLRADDSPDQDEGDSGSGFRVVVSGITLRTGAISIERQGSAPEHIDNIELESSRIEIGRAGTRVVLGRLVAQLRERGFGVEASGSLAMAGESAVVTNLEIRAAGATVSLERAAVRGLAIDDLTGAAILPADALRAIVPTSPLLVDTTLAFSLADGGGVDISGASGTAIISGKATVGVSSARLHLAIRGLDLSTVMLGLPRSMLALEIDAERLPASISADVSATGQLEGKSIKSSRISLAKRGDTLDVEVTASGSDLTIDGTAVLALGEELEIASGHVELESRKLSSVAAPWINVEGDLRASLDISGRPGALSLSGVVRSSNLAGMGFRARGLVVRPRLRQLGPLRASGSVSVAADAVGDGVTEIQNVLITANSSDGERGRLAVSGRGVGVSLELTSNVTMDEDELRVDLVRARGSYRELLVSADKGAAIWRHRAGVAVLRGIELTSNAGAFSIDGELRPGGTLDGTLVARARDVDLAMVSKIAAIEPALRGRASIEATIDSRRGRAELTASVDGFFFRSDLPAISGTAALELRGSDLDVSLNAALDGVGQASLTALASAPRRPFDVASWRGFGYTELRILAADANVSNFGPLTHLHPELPQGGTFAVTATKSEGSAGLRIEVAATDVKTVRAAEPLTAKASIALDDRRVLASASAAVNARANGKADAVVALPLEWHQPGAFAGLDIRALEQAHLEVGGIDVDWWLEPYLANYKASGARAAVTADYSAQTKVATLAVKSELPRGGPTGRTISQSTELIATVSPDSSTVELSADFAGQRHLSGRGTLAFGWLDALRGSRDPLAAKASMTISIKKLPLLALREIARTTPIAADAAISGTLSGSASMTGTLAKPEGAVNLSISGAVLSNVAFSSLLAAASLRKGKIDLTATGDQAGGGRLIVRGESDLSRGAAAEFSAVIIASDLDLEFVNELIPSLAIGGKLTADLQATGPLLGPVVVGEVAVKGGRITLGAPLHALRDADLRAVLERDRVSVKGTARSGRGSAEIDANMTLGKRGPEKFSLVLTTEKIPLDGGSLLLRIDSRTKVNGQLKGRKWVVSADIEEAVINLPDELSRSLHPTTLPSDVVFVENLGKGKMAGALTGRPTEIALSIRANDSILVRGAQANAVLGLSLDVTARDELRMSGTVRADQGWVELISRRYDVRVGEVSFDGSLDPSLNVELTHEFRTLSLFIDVSGNASSPVVEFRSDPAQYDDSELLAFVLGANPDEPIGGERNVASQAATGVATSLLAGQLSNVVTKVTPIDVLRIDTEDSAADRIAFGKWLTDRLLVAYRYRLAAEPNENRGEVTFEYRFLKRWLLEGYVGQEESGADVLWIRRF